MKFLIIGTGGTGGCIGGYLAKQGEDVTFIARGEHLKKIQENGIISQKIQLLKLSGIQLKRILLKMN